jgi:hypothetical protein
MVIFMALAEGESRMLCGPLTLHTETAIHIAQRLTGATFQVLHGARSRDQWSVTTMMMSTMSWLPLTTMMPRQVKPSPGSQNSWLITCQGIGLRNPALPSSA